MLSQSKFGEIDNVSFRDCETYFLVVVPYVLRVNLRILLTAYCLADVVCEQETTSHR